MADKERQVLRIILLEGAANLCVLAMKLVVGFATGSMAIFADALHSLTDVSNNVIAWIVIRASNQPADREHPYGHRKFEVVAVFVLATLLATVAVELGIRAITRETQNVTMSGWNLYVMLIVLVVNFLLSTWQRGWAKRLHSQILLAGCFRSGAIPGSIPSARWAYRS
jgi:cation diffusion facilitator family transporter